MEIINLTSSEFKISIEQDQNKLTVHFSHGQHGHVITFCQFRPMQADSLKVQLTSKDTDIGFPSHKYCQFTFSAELKVYIFLFKRKLFIADRNSIQNEERSNKSKGLVQSLLNDLFDRVVLNFLEDNVITLAFLYDIYGLKFDLFPILISSKFNDNFYHYYRSKETFNSIMRSILGNSNYCRIREANPEKYLVYLQKSESSGNGVENLQSAKWIVNINSLNDYCFKNHYDIERIMLFTYNLPFTRS